MIGISSPLPFEILAFISVVLCTAKKGPNLVLSASQVTTILKQSIISLHRVMMCTGPSHGPAAKHLLYNLVILAWSSVSL